MESSISIVENDSDCLVVADKARVGKWVSERVNHTGNWGDYYGMGATKNGELVAGIVMNNYNGANATCHIAISKPTKLLKPLFTTFCNYAFVQCGMKRLTGMVPTNEPKIIKFDKHLGFEEDCILKDGADGADMMLLVLWPDKCRWLNKE